MDTEDRVERYHDVDTWPAEKSLAAMLEHQMAAFDAVRNALPALVRAVEGAADRLRCGGRLVYAGAGASGRIAVQDGVELHPTFGWPRERLCYLIAGGERALVESIEGAEDDQAAGVAAVMVARAALVKPWIFREAIEGDWDISAETRVALYRRYADLAREHWGDDEHGMTRVRMFIRWHLDFWCRYVPRHADGTYPSMQRREAAMPARSPLEALLARDDEPAFDYVTGCLAHNHEINPVDAPPAAPPTAADRDRRRQDIAEVEG